MIVLGVGLDLVAVSRVERLLGRHGDRVLDRLLTQTERDYCVTRAAPAIHVAARLAAKEAAYKALAACGRPTAIGWRDVEVVRDESGRPILQWHGTAATRWEDAGARQSLLSLTHVTSHAAAVVLLLG